MNGPLALTGKEKGALILAALNREACALGLSIGMKLADARAREPELAAIPHDPEADRQWLERLTRHCERYTPLVAAEPPQSLILDMTGCLHLHASEKGLAQRIEDDLDALGFSCNWAFARTTDAALALARYGLKEGAEAQLPVAALGMDARIVQALERAGLYRIGDLSSRPRGPLAARFGAEMVLKLERLLGEEDRPVNPARRQSMIIAERRFAEPLGHLDSVEQILAELFAEASLQLEERHQGARHIAMRLFRCDGHIARLAIETGAPTRDEGLFARLLAERLDSLHDPLDPGFGYDLVRLAIIHAEPLKMRQVTDDGAQEKHTEEAALLSQISIRLGRERIRRFTSADSHIPEHALTSLPALEPPLPFSWEKPPAGEPPGRPLLLFDPPQPISVMAEVPDGPPRRFLWKKQMHLVTRAEGPERIASEWWRRRKGYLPGKGGLTRDYYRIEDSDGRRYWLFRHGLYGSEKERPDWYVHGRFA